jgi:hypothetical protein
MKRSKESAMSRTSVLLDCSLHELLGNITSATLALEIVAETSSRKDSFATSRILNMKDHLETISKDCLAMLQGPTSPASYANSTSKKSAVGSRSLSPTARPKKKSKSSSVTIKEDLNRFYLDLGRGL